MWLSHKECQPTGAQCLPPTSCFYKVARVRGLWGQWGMLPQAVDLAETRGSHGHSRHRKGWGCRRKSLEGVPGRGL